MRASSFLEEVPGEGVGLQASSDAGAFLACPKQRFFFQTPHFVLHSGRIELLAFGVHSNVTVGDAPNSSRPRISEPVMIRR
jgi:hypothetical protein